MLPVGAPLRGVVERGPAEVVLPPLLSPAPIADHQPVLAGAVAEPGDLLPVGRPDRAAIVRAGSSGQVASVAVLTRHGDDLAPRLEDRALSVRSDRRPADRAAHFLPARSRGQAVAPHANLQALDLLGVRVVGMNRPALLEHHHAGSAGNVPHVELTRGGHLLRLPRTRLVAPQVHHSVAVGAEVDETTEPRREGVVGVLARDLLDVVRFGIVDPHPIGATSAVALPAAECVAKRGVGDAFRVRSVGGVRRTRNRERLRGAARDRRTVEARLRSARLAPARKDHVRRVGVPTLDVVAAGVKREAPGDPAVDRQEVDVGVALVLRRVRHPRAVGAQVRARLPAHVAGEAACIPPAAGRDPEIVSVDEDDVLGGDRRVLQEECLVRGLRPRRRGREEHHAPHDGQEKRAHSSVNSSRQPHPIPFLAIPLEAVPRGGHFDSLRYNENPRSTRARALMARGISDQLGDGIESQSLDNWKLGSSRWFAGPESRRSCCSRS